MKSILITGGSGLIGRALIPKLQALNYELTILSRKKNYMQKNVAVMHWNKEGGIDQDTINSFDYIIHLAGANIGRRWTRKRKTQILESRTELADLIFRNVHPQKTKLKAFIASSAVGYYGIQDTKSAAKENEPPGDDFLARVCQEWEKSTKQFADKEIREVRIRAGIVLSNAGGALPKLQRLTSVGLGSALGSGKQYMPWIHIDDLCAIYLHAIHHHNINGAYNGVAPQKITNYEFIKTLAQVNRKPFFLPKVPAFLLKLRFGEMASILLKGRAIDAEKILSNDFQFRYYDLETALKSVK